MSASKVFRFESAEDSPGFLLWQLTMVWQREIQRTLAPLNLTHTQFVLLATTHWLSQHHDIVWQVAIARQARLDRMTTSKVLRTLEEKALIARTADANDTRAKRVELTQSGLALVGKAVAAVEATDAGFFGFAGKDLAAFKTAAVAILRASADAAQDGADL